jgi:hypothetical protein
MTPALEQLAELVRQAEAKTRARKIEGETRQAAESFRTAELRARRAVERLRIVRPASTKALEQADADEQLLKELIRKLAVYKSSLGSDADAERLIETSQAEIERTRQQTRRELEEVTREVDEARRDLRIATDAYKHLRREVDRLQPELGERFAPEDRLLWDAEAHFPGGQLGLLAHEVDAGMSAYAALNKIEQYARLKVWIGRFRLYQATHDRESDATEELQALSHRVFHQLKFLSRQYEPGYIEAFRQDYSTDWTSYVAEAQEQLVQAVEASRRAREADSHHHRERDLGHERLSLPAAVAGVATSPAGTNHTAPTGASLADLKSVIAHVQLPDDGLEQFLVAVKRTVDDVGSNHPELLRLLEPYRRHINRDNGFAALRQNLDARDPESAAESKVADPE